MQHLPFPAQESAPEASARLMLDAYLQKMHQTNREKNVDELLSCNNYAGRFEWFLPFLDAAAKEHILLSGCAVGSELLVAEHYGFLQIAGTETDATLAEIARVRLQSKTEIRIDVYDGKHLPYANDSFSMICSAHIIEHTPEPGLYFQEHFRVLKPGGYFFLEFPNRYHHTELHTGLPSVEWLPHALRRNALQMLSSKHMPFPQRTKEYYRLILQTLQPISIAQIRHFLHTSDAPNSHIVAKDFPAPGFVRLLLRKVS